MAPPGPVTGATLGSRGVGTGVGLGVGFGDGLGVGFGVGSGAGGSGSGSGLGRNGVTRPPGGVFVVGGLPWWCSGLGWVPDPLFSGGGSPCALVTPTRKANPSNRIATAVHRLEIKRLEGLEAFFMSSCSSVWNDGPAMALVTTTRQVAPGAMSRRRRFRAGGPG